MSHHALTVHPPGPVAEDCHIEGRSRYTNDELCMWMPLGAHTHTHLARALLFFTLLKAVSWHPPETDDLRLSVQMFACIAALGAILLKGRIRN